MDNQKKRVAWIDAAKGTGMICIVLGHVLQGNHLLRQFLYAFNVPFFFFLMGVTFSYKADRKAFYFRKAKRLMIPYYCFGVISILIFHFLGKYASRLSSDYATTEIIPNLIGMIYGNNRTGLMKWNSPLWFLTCSFAVYTIAENVETLQHRNKSIICIRAVCSIICLGCAFVLLSAFKNIKLPFQFETALLMYPFFSFGQSFKERILLCKEGGLFRRKIPLASVMIVLLVIGGLISYVNGYTDAATSIYGKGVWLYFLSALFISGGGIALSVLIQDSRVVRFIGVNSLPVLLMHKFPVLFFQTAVSPINHLVVDEAGTLKSNMCALLITIVCIAMCLAVTFVLKRLAPWSIGIEKR